MTTVAIQGEAGSFSHAAALELHGPALELLPCPTFPELFRAVESGAAQRGVVPFENTLAGSVHENYDLLSEHRLHAVGETLLRIRHCLIARPGTALSEIRRVASHPVALAQCRRFFAEHPALEPVPAYDTAGSVRSLMARDSTASTDAAIASALAARLYGAAVIAEDLEDHAENYTRFLEIAPEPARVQGPSKTLLVFGVSNTPGALHRALGVFADRGINLNKIESRPLPGRPWEYLFYVDVLADSAEQAHAAIEQLRGVTSRVRILGTFTPAGSAAPR